MPDSLHERLREFAKKDNISINQFVTSAVTEKLAAFSTLAYLEARGREGNRAKFEAIMARVPDAEPDQLDR